MKRVFKGFLTIGFAFSLAGIPAVLLRAQSIVENPAKPPAADAGRVIVLKEVQRITDQEGKFFFVQPFNIVAGKDGSIYVQEYKQFLKFDPSGKFVRNLLRWGQGPGELNDNLNSVLVTDNEIILYSGNVLKALRMDLQGKVIETKTFPTSIFHDIVAYRKGIYFFTRPEWSSKAKELLFGEPGIKELDFRLVKVDGNGTVTPTSTLLPLTNSVHRGGHASISYLYHVQADERYAFLNHSPEYLVKILDLETGEIIKSFRREYKRVPFIKRKYPNIPYTLPSPNYNNDICRLLMRGDKLWVVTSTFDEKKGILVDVYDRDGKYLDNFYLPLLKIGRVNPAYFACMAVSGDFLYVIEHDKDDLVVVVKYEIHGA